jgi:hypothetical protein
MLRGITRALMDVTRWFCWQHIIFQYWMLVIPASSDSSSELVEFSAGMMDIVDDLCLFLRCSC